MSMQVWVGVQLLTFVLLVARPATATTPPKTNMPPTRPPVTEPAPTSDGREIQDYNLMPSPPAEPLSKEATETFYFPYRQALSPRLGAVFTTEKENAWEYLLGINYLWPRYASPQAELGVDLLSHFGGHLNFGVRYILFQRNYFRPFFLWGMTHEVVATERLATITNIDNYYLRLAVGMEDTLKLPKSIRLELETLIGLEKQMLLLCFGYSWGF